MSAKKTTYYEELLNKIKNNKAIAIIMIIAIALVTVLTTISSVTDKLEKIIAYFKDEAVVPDQQVTLLVKSNNKKWFQKVCDVEFTVNNKTSENLVIRKLFFRAEWVACARYAADIEDTGQYDVDFKPWLDYWDSIRYIGQNIDEASDFKKKSELLSIKNNIVYIEPTQKDLEAMPSYCVDYMKHSLIVVPHPKDIEVSSIVGSYQINSKSVDKFIITTHYSDYASSNMVVKCRIHIEFDNGRSILTDPLYIALTSD